MFNFRAGDSGLLDDTSSDGSDIVISNEQRCRSYAKLFYYIHLLGDCYEDKNFYQANGSGNGQKLPLGREHPGNSIQSSDLISEIMRVCEELFSLNEINANRYTILKSQLNKEKAAITNLYKNGGVNSEERYKLYHERVCSLMEVLMFNLPNILRNEQDFSEAFSDMIYDFPY